jgi:Flp pilus assembly pilin Flp
MGGIVGRTRAALRARRDGQTLAEYVLILALISIFCIAMLSFLAEQVNLVFNNVGAVLNSIL